ncbi:hypothetical protein GH714_017935 [Hevea brasiliensis]|uniref:Rx N-terminal domain-containing protein n=1 Tax=Hevea brasiliensis TaxID=3981 RepID=A0A6A6N0E9_HEVBR|nr:hypothetical protein GH714_017935 [Hevea brasiliensis]
MARSFSNAKVLSAFITKANRRGFSAAAAVPQGVVSTVKKTAEEKIGFAKKVAWIPDPRNGCYRPENGLLHRLNSIDFMKYIGQGQVLTQLKKWEKMLKRIHAVLEDAEEKQTANRLVEIWLSDLRDLAYDLEDIIDELATEVQRHNLEDKSVRTNNKVQNCFSIMCNGVNVNLSTVKFNAEMVSKIEKAGARLDEIIKQKDELRLAEYTRRRVSHVTERPPSTSLVNEAKVYGREEDKKAMLKLLNAETNDAEVSVIPIIGMGGLGKTTLAQLVYNDAILEFDLKAWVSVGEDFDVSGSPKQFFFNWEIVVMMKIWIHSR